MRSLSVVANTFCSVLSVCSYYFNRWSWIQCLHPEWISMKNSRSHSSLWRWMIDGIGIIHKRAAFRAFSQCVIDSFLPRTTVVAQRLDATDLALYPWLLSRLSVMLVTWDTATALKQRQSCTMLPQSPVFFVYIIMVGTTREHLCIFTLTTSGRSAPLLLKIKGRSCCLGPRIAENFDFLLFKIY